MAGQVLQLQVPRVSLPWGGGRHPGGGGPPGIPGGGPPGIPGGGPPGIPMGGGPPCIPGGGPPGIPMGGGPPNGGGIPGIPGGGIPGRMELIRCWNAAWTCAWKDSRCSISAVFSAAVVGIATAALMVSNCA